MTEIVYLGRSHKAFRNSSLGMTFAMSKLGVSKLFPEKKALTSGLGSWNIFRGKKLYTLQSLLREEFAFMSLTVADEVYFSGKNSYALWEGELFPPMQSSHLPLVNSNSSLPVILPVGFGG